MRAALLQRRFRFRFWLPSPTRKGTGGEVRGAATFKIKKGCAMDDDDDTGDANPGEDA